MRAGQDLGKRDTTGKNAPALDSSGLNPFGNGFWAAHFDGDRLPAIPFEIWKMTIRGPAGIQVQIYRGTELISNTGKASLNEWSRDTIPMDPGDGLNVYWSSAATPAPYLAIYLRSR